jgi:hypothetical protein
VGPAPRATLRDVTRDRPPGPDSSTGTGTGTGTGGTHAAAAPAAWWTRVARLRTTAPDWALALGLFAAGRLFDAYLLARSAHAGRLPSGTVGGYLGVLQRWDATWYHRIAQEGYPARLPVGSDGLVQPNSWAFYPLFPQLTRALTVLTGPGWTGFLLAGTVVSLICGAAAAVLVVRLVSPLAGRRLGLWTVALLAFFPSAAVLQMPYAESLALLLLVAVLLCLHRGRYLAAAPLLVLAGLSRPIGVPLAAVVVLHALRVVLRRRRQGDVPTATLIRLGVAAAAAAVGAVAWPVVAALRTGRLDAYTSTMAAWRTPRTVQPFVPWRTASEEYLGRYGLALLAVAVIGYGVWLARRRAAAVLSADLRAWCACYAAYLLAVLDAFASLPRYLVLLFPLGTLLAAVSRDRAYRVALLIASAAGSVVWVAAFWWSSTMAP